MRVSMQNPGAVAAEAAAQARNAAQVAREQVQAAREQAQSQRQAAQQARDDARDQAREQARDAREGTRSGGGERVITINTPDGKTVTLSNPTADALAQVGFPVRVERQESDGPFVVGGIAIMATAVVLLVALTQRYRIRMRGAGPSTLPADLTQRLTRMEAGIESVAVEVERISEGQRFTARLLSDRERVEVPRG